MKKMICMVIAILALFSLAACGSEKESKIDSSGNQTPTFSTLQDKPAKKESGQEFSTSESTQSASDIDVDLTKLSSTMIYSEVYNMMVNPDKYLGKTIKMSGAFAYYEDSETENQYFACIVADATACCSQGLEFVLAGEHTYPEDYPEVYSDITVTGTFKTYTENGIKYSRLVDAVMES